MKRTTLLTAISFFFIISGIILACSSGLILDIIMGKLLDLTPGEVLYKKWIESSPAMTFDIYFFNWSNPHDFSDESKKPSFSEIGPFRFNVRIEKVNVTYNNQNETMSYTRRKWYKFVREESAQDLDFNVTILNQLSAAIAYKARNMNFFKKKGSSMFISSVSNIHLTKRVGELLFEGFPDKTLDIFRMLDMKDVPEKFGYFYKKNGSNEGTFNIGTGRGQFALGTLYSWNGQNSSKYYGETCREISGASMDFYTDNIIEKKVEIFHPELCRKIPLDYAGKSTVHGIEGQKFEVDDSFLDNGTIIPGNECFCADQCIRYGAVPAAVCKKKTNNYITLPHFLKADPFYASRVEGMKPNAKEHSFHVVVEPF
ncbi:hypothetical protein HHI36_008342 [Cryptolaemus montrouzieri]|uniref:Uncharacterized protein n=1 Tax=Cryptolaemus montrouzieri TaxID=559131 RepID=A0ABD2MSB8_9CUCU